MTTPAIRTAASVLVANSRFELLFVKRASSLQWANAFVWPGGVQEAADQGDDRVTALREAFEETGLLFDARGYAVSHVPQRDEWRRRVHADASAFGLLCGELGLALPLGSVKRLAHWTTPKAEKKRFDTRFFLVQLHGADLARGLKTDAESSELAWMTPRHVLEQFALHRVVLAPPQWYIMNQLARFDRVDDALRACDQMTRVEHIAPTIAFDEQSRPVICLPGDELNDVASNADGALASRRGVRRRIVIQSDASDASKRSFALECSVPALSAFPLDAFAALAQTPKL